MTDDSDIDGLAGEYVLGSLSAGERAEVKARLMQDAALRTAVQSWERRLGSLSHLEPGVAPPASVLPNVLAEVAKDAARRAEDDKVVSLRRQVTRWKWTSASLAASIALAAIAVSALPGLLPSTRDERRIAVLAKVDSNPLADEPEIAAGPVFVATYDKSAGKLSVRQVAGRRPPSGRFHAIWLMAPAAEAPNLLGVIPRGAVVATLDLAVLPRGRPDAEIAVSVESSQQPSRPSSPVIAVGRLGAPGG